MAEKEYTHVTQEIGTGDSDSECLNISLELDNESEDLENVIATYKIIVRAYGATKNENGDDVPLSISDVEPCVTLGEVDYIGIEEEIIEDEIVVIEDGSVSAKKYVTEIVSQSLENGNVNDLIAVDGELEMPKGEDDSDKGCIPIGYGVVKITYLSKWLKFLIKSSKDGIGLFILTEREEETCRNSIEYQFGVEAGKEKKDIMIIYRDFVTGVLLSETSLWVDDIYRGITDEQGKLLVEQLTVGVTHTLRAEKEGYLASDSDSLKNDSFIIN